MNIYPRYIIHDIGSSPRTLSGHDYCFCNHLGEVLATPNPPPYHLSHPHFPPPPPKATALATVGSWDRGWLTGGVSVGSWDRGWLTGGVSVGSWDRGWLTGGVSVGSWDRGWLTGGVSVGSWDRGWLTGGVSVGSWDGMVNRGCVCWKLGQGMVHEK